MFLVANGSIRKQRALSLNTWPDPTIGSVIGSSCVWTRIVACDNSVLSSRFNTCPPYFKVESKVTRDFGVQSSMFTYTVNLDVLGFAIVVNELE